LQSYDIAITRAKPKP